MLLLRSAPPVILRLSLWTARPDATALHAAKTNFEATMRAAAAPQSAGPEPAGTAVVPTLWGSPVPARHEIPVTESTGPSAAPAMTPGGTPPETTAASRGAPTPDPNQLPLGLGALVGDVAPNGTVRNAHNTDT